MKHSETTDRIIRVFYKVYNTLGYGFLERVYQNSMHLELIKEGLQVEAQKKIQVFYNGQVVGDYYADLIIDDVVIIELKAHECLLEEHEMKCN